MKVSKASRDMMFQWLQSRYGYATARIALVTLLVELTRAPYYAIVNIGEDEINARHSGFRIDPKIGASDGNIRIWKNN